MARRLYGGPPLVHHEDGFNEDEAERLDPKRNFYRRLGLPAAFRLVVPSERLEKIALREWRQPSERMERIANGIPVARYRAGPQADIPGLVRAEGEIVIGTAAGLRAVKNLPRLVRALAAMTAKNARLVIVGEGPESERIAAEARRLGVADRLVLSGFLADPARWIGRFDIFALSSDSEQFPISLIEAMAAGLPAVSTDVGDVAAMLSADNRPLVVAREDEAGFAAALDSLAARADLRKAIGRANREKAAAEYDEERMIGSYAALYGAAIGRPDAFNGPRT
jgi:glycosyltransferase involved in cell wall biosynthesis